MSKLLIVKGHPLNAESSLSLQGLNAFIKAYKAAHPSDEIEQVDVFQDSILSLNAELLAAMFAGEQATAEQKALLADFGKFTDQFIAADKIVIANPLYNSMIPAELKTWIDTIWVAGKTFKYTPEGQISLVPGKKVLHLQANGGIYEGKDPATAYIKFVFDFFKDDYKQIVIEGHAYQPERREELLADFIQKVETEAQTF